MEDFRSQLTALIDHMTAEGDVPLFLIVEMEGAFDIKRTRGQQGLDSFKADAIQMIGNNTDGADAFTYGDDKLVVILSAKEYDRLKTFALIQKLRRTIPLLGQQFDCFLRPECDVIEYDPKTGAAGLISIIARPKPATGMQQEQTG